MKKVLIILLVIIAVVAGGVWYALSNAGDIIKTQIEQQGSKFLGTQVSVFNVDLALSEGRLTINDIDVENPQGFSDEDAFSLEAITLDIGNVTSEPYRVQSLTVNAPEILYELDAAGKGNLIVLKDNLAANLTASGDTPPPSESKINPLVIVEEVIISNAKLTLNFEAVPTGEYEIEKKVYEVTLPTFSAGAVGEPNGLPADQVGAAVAKAMLDNAIAKAKQEAKDRLKNAAKDKIQEKVDEEKEKLLDKAKDKLSGFLKDKS
ncbi:hypothetical protein [Glaciecola sp. 1036]|uniref:hypothetical protein n=1 Tax=Alteromonadaceae TaxID=72275 RepID=UPI003CFFDB7D